MRIVQSDSATVYTAGEFAALCLAQGIHQRFSAPYSQSQNGRAERFWRTLENQVACMYSHSHLVPLKLWTYAIYYFVHVHNRTTAATRTETPFELLTGSKPDISHFRTWGCPVFAFIEKHQHDKFEPKAQAGVNLGPDRRTKDGYHIYFSDTDTIRTTRNVSFDELWRHRAAYYHALQSASPNASLFPVADMSPPQPPAPAPATIADNDSESDIEDNGREAAYADRERTPPPPPLPPLAPAPLPMSPAAPPETPCIIRQPAPPPPYAQPPNVVPDGPNTNKADTRHEPVTALTDTYDIATVRPSTAPVRGSATRRFHTEWAPSYNMTQEAIDSRTTLTGLDVPFQTAHITPSAYNPLNFDVHWKPSLEPQSTFLTEDGSYLPVFASMHNDTRADRAARRTQPIPQAPHAMANFAFALFTATSITSSKSSSYYSSPLDSSPPTSRFHSPALGHYHSLFQHHQSNQLMCFVSVRSPSYRLHSTQLRRSTMLSRCAPLEICTRF